MFWHHDVGLSFPKSVGALIGGSDHLLRSDFYLEKNRHLICLCYTLKLTKKHHIVDISLNYVNFLLKQPLLHEIHDLLAFHYLKELIFQETTISLSKGAYFSRNHHIVDKSQYLINLTKKKVAIAHVWYL